VSETREPLRRTFEAAADLYESARPSYPDELFDDLIELARLEPGSGRGTCERRAGILARIMEALADSA
jgi:hypothetical protein